jgi:5-methylcytosine-specific restriction endonuclease McrA
MRPTQSRRSQIRLDWDAYPELRQQVLERDGWRCQYCGRREQLEVHHLLSRAQRGADTELNLIALCALCHSQLHRGGKQNRL